MEKKQTLPEKIKIQCPFCKLVDLHQVRKSKNSKLTIYCVNCGGFFDREVTAEHKIKTEILEQSAKKEIARHIGENKLQFLYEIYKKMVKIKKFDIYTPYPKELNTIVKSLRASYTKGYLTGEEAEQLQGRITRAIMLGTGGESLSKSFRAKYINLMHYIAQKRSTYSGMPKYPLNIFICSLIGELRAAPERLTFDKIYLLIENYFDEMKIHHGHIKTQYDRWIKPNNKRANLSEFFDDCIRADRSLFTAEVVNIKNRHFPKK